MIPVFFTPAMVARNAGHYSPSALKPAQVVGAWQADFDIAPEIDVIDFEPAARETLALAHDARYVDDVLAGRADNGFNNRDRGVAASLPFTSGSMLAAARHVLRMEAADAPIACSPSSGFHHANHAYGHGFCTFNGLMVTALALKSAGLVNRVLILDCDQHYGDGTQDIIETTGARWVTHVTHGGTLPGSYRSAGQMTAMIERHLPGFGSGESGGLVLYQAGADCHVDDPLGGFLSTSQMRERDRLVFSLAVEHRVPLVWNLAGGYQRDRQGGIAPVLELHRQTMIECIECCAMAR